MALITKDEIKDSGDNFHYAPFDDSDIQDNAKQPEGAPKQLPNKEDSAESFALSCSIGKNILTALADLGSSINVVPLSLFRSLNITCLVKTNLVIEMANMTRATPVGVVNNIIVMIDCFLFLADFVVIDMVNIPNEDLIFGRPFLATARARLDVFKKEISLGAYDERVTFNMSQTSLIRNEGVTSSCVANTANEEPYPAHMEFLMMCLTI